MKLWHDYKVFEEKMHSFPKRWQNSKMTLMNTSMSLFLNIKSFFPLNIPFLFFCFFFSFCTNKVVIIFIIFIIYINIDSRLVLDTIHPLESSRRCFRLVGGVLIERTVGEILPAVQSSHDGVLKHFLLIIY